MAAGSDSLIFRYGFVVLFFLLSGANIDIQAQGGYYIRDNHATYGAKLVDGGALKNAAYCVVETRSNDRIYTPDEVSEYGFPDGRVYVAKTIAYDGIMRRVFLERLSEGRLVLYYYHGADGITFFIETEDGELNLLPLKDEKGNSFRHYIAEFTADFPEGFDALQNVAYRKSTLTMFFARYEKRQHRPFPHFRYGLNLGFGLTDLLPQPGNQIMRNTSFRKARSFSAGVFADQPLLLSDFSLNAGINISRQVYSSFWTSDDGDEDYYAKSVSVGIPLLLRHTWPSNRFRPFVNAGGLALLNVDNHNILYRNTFTDNTINLEIDRTNYISDVYTGLTAGAGLEYRIRGRGSLLTEIRYSHLWPHEKPLLINLKVLNLTIGYSF